MVNGTSNLQLAGLVFVQQPDARAELEAWQSAIGDLDNALVDLTAARTEIEAQSNLLDRIEASKVLTIEGGNAETRKARLTLALADDARYQTHADALRDARMRLMDAERRVQVSKERCRLLRAACAIAEQ